MVRCHCWQLSVLRPVLVASSPRGENKTSAGTSVLSGGAFFFFPILRSGQASFPEDVVKFVEDELHRLVLVNHVDRHVPVVPFWTHERRSEHDADVLRGHAVAVWVLQHSADRQDMKRKQESLTSEENEQILDFEMFCCTIMYTRGPRTPARALPVVPNHCCFTDQFNIRQYYQGLAIKMTQKSTTKECKMTVINSLFYEYNNKSV